MAMKVVRIVDIAMSDEELVSDPIRFETPSKFSAIESIGPVEPVVSGSESPSIRAEFQAANEMRFGRQRFSLHVAVQISAS